MADRYDFDLYEALGVSREASQEEIKKAFRALAKAHHPDQHPGEDHEAIFKRATQAYDILGEEGKRKDYDAAHLFAASSAKTSSHNRHREESKPSAPSYNPEDQVQRVAAFVAPKPFLQEPKIKDGFWLALTSTLVILLTFLVALTLFLPMNGGLALLAVPGLALAGIIYSYKLACERWPVKSPDRRTGWILTLLVPLGALFGTAKLFGVKRSFWTMKGAFPLEAWYNFLAAPAATTVVAFLLGSYWVQWWRTNKLLGNNSWWRNRTPWRTLPEAFASYCLKSSNSFGRTDGSAEARSVEESLNDLWDLKPLRVINLDSPLASHVLILNDRVILVKGLRLYTPSVMSYSSGALFAQVGYQQFEQVVRPEYLLKVQALAKQLKGMAKVYSLVSVYPSTYLRSFDEEAPLTVVKGDDLAKVAGDLLTEGTEENYVDVELIASVVRAVLQA